MSTLAFAAQTKGRRDPVVPARPCRLQRPQLVHATCACGRTIGPTGVITGPGYAEEVQIVRLLRQEKGLNRQIVFDAYFTDAPPPISAPLRRLVR